MKPMIPDFILNKDIADDNGWTTTTMLTFFSDFIKSNGLSEELRDYLVKMEEEENLAMNVIGYLD